MATSWTSFTAANAAVGQVNCLDSTSNNFKLTGVQLEVGSVATPFEHRSYGEELQRCKRYYQQYPEIASDGYSVFPSGSVVNQTTTSAHWNLTWNPVMRAAPTFTLTGNTRLIHQNGVPAITGLTPHNYSASTFISSLAVSSGLTAGGASTFVRNNDTSAFIKITAEL